MLRILTVLIEDKRTPEPDNQLAEVRVGLRQTENPEDDGFWADAKEVVDELQSGPARIDGVFMFDQIEDRPKFTREMRSVVALVSIRRNTIIVDCPRRGTIAVGV